MKRLALIFDFDNTLAPDNMHEHSFLSETLKIDKTEFYEELAKIEDKYQADYVLNMMRGLIEIPAKHGINVTRKLFNDIGTKIPLFKGVQDFFSRIREYGIQNNVTVEYYIISSGYKEMLEGTSIYNEFNAVYASEFCYNRSGHPIWPKKCVNYSNKVQFISRIRKNIADDNEFISVNKKYSFRATLPYSHMIYFGDGETDVPSFKVLKMFGGHTVCIYKENEEKMAKQLYKDKRIQKICLADYSENSQIDTFVKSIIKNL